MPWAVMDREQDAQSHSRLPRRHCEVLDPPYHDPHAGRSKGYARDYIPVALLSSIH